MALLSEGNGPSRSTQLSGHPKGPHPASPSRRALIQASILTIGMRGAAAASAILMHFLVARLLGAEGTGVFFLVLALMIGCTDVGRFGLRQNIVRFVSPALNQGDDRRAAQYVLTGAIIVLAFTIAIVGAILGLLGLVGTPQANGHGEVLRLFKAFAWAAAPVALLGYLSGVIEAFRRPVLGSFFEVGAVPTLVCIALGGALLLLPAGTAVTLDLVSTAYMASSLVACIAAAVWVMRRLGRPGRLSGEDFLTLYHASHPLLVVNIAGYLTRYAPLLALGWFATTAEAGIFSVAFRIAAALSILLASVNSTVGPGFAVSYQKGDMRALERELSIASLTLVILSFPVIVGLWVFADPLLSLMGKEFESGRPLLLILLAGQAVNMATASSGRVLVMTKNERALRRNTTISAVFCVALCAALIPFWGGMGAALAAAAAMALQGAMATWQVHRIVGVRMFSMAAFGATVPGE